jgi:hypothetical protein
MERTTTEQRTSEGAEMPSGKRTAGAVLCNQASMLDLPGNDCLMIDPGFLLDKRGQGLKLFLGEFHFTPLFLGLGQVPLEIQKRFPKIVEHGLQGIQGQDKGLLVLAIGQQFPSPLQLIIGMIDVGLAIHGKTSRGGLAKLESKYHTSAAEFILINYISMLAKMSANLLFNYLNATFQ